MRLDRDSGRDVQGDGDDSPERAWPGLDPVCVGGIELDRLAAGRDDLGQAFGEDLILPIVPDNSQRNHRTLGARGIESMERASGKGIDGRRV